jgi:SpoVK/Ycf46/Vps4 family AAA+-type ATPase
MFSILVKIIALCNYGVNNAILSGKNITILDKDDSNINLIEINNQIIENNKIKEDLYNYNYSFNVDLLNCSRDIKFLTDKIIKNKVLNFSMCIYGDPGTGKSAYAKFLAKKLGLDIVCKSAADILDPYVGNSEKLIKETFQEAKEKHAVLIIDEIDSFLRSRSLAQRNWEVSMVNQMLTCMESFSYPFICTTNFIDTLDQASLRRFTFKFKFGFLKQNQIESAFSYIFNCKPSETILKMQGLTISDIVNIKKECDILGIIDINEISNMLEENLVLKKSGDLRKNIGFN